jgi:thiamine biosynthesis lipoprotein
MKQTKIMMNMPITIEIVDSKVQEDDFREIFDYFKNIEEKFSFFKDTSEVSKINRGEISLLDYSEEMKNILNLAEDIKKMTIGYFNIVTADGKINPSGIVKGWAIQQAINILIKKGFENFYLEVGGDVQICGKNSQNKAWQIGVRNPFNLSEIVKNITLANNEGVATSGTYIRGEHIYNPLENYKPITDIVSLTVVGPNIYQADCMATAGFAMGKNGILFIEDLDGFEGYMIDKNGLATMTSGFENYLY